MATWAELNKQPTQVKTQTKTGSGWSAFNEQMKQQAIQQESKVSGVDPALYTQLRERGLSQSDVSQTVKEPEKVSYLKTLGQVAKETLNPLTHLNNVFRGISASSQVLAAPIAAAAVKISPTAGGSGLKDETPLTPKQAWDELIGNAKDTILGKREIGIETKQLSKEYLKSREYLYEKKVPTKLNEVPSALMDLAIVGFLGFSEMFGDPAFSFPAIKTAKEIKNTILWKKTGEISKQFKEGVSLVKGTTNDLEIPISQDLKIKIRPKENEVIFQGYKKRFPTQKALPDNQMAKETQDLVINTREATGMELQAKFVGDDLVMKPTTPIVKAVQPIIKGGERMYKIIKEEGVEEVKGAPVKIVDGVDTFIHEGTGGWVVSEASTGRYLADSRTKDGAIAKAKFEISNVGEDKFKQIISEKQLIQPTIQDPLIQKAKKYKKAEVRDKIGTKLQDPYTAEYLPTNPDGTITLYHSTTKEGAEKIKQSGIFGSKTEGGDIYFTTNKKGYGGIGKDKDVVLAFNVDPKKIKFDDVYRGELHLKGNNTDIGGLKPNDIYSKAQEKVPVVEPEIKKSKLGLRIEQEMVNEGLVKELKGLPEYEKMNLNEQSQLATDLINTDFEKAKRIAMGREMPEGKLLPESVYIAMKKFAKKNNDNELRIQLARSHTVSEATFMGQRIRALGENDPNDPVKIIRDISQARAKRAKVTKKELTAEEKKIQSEIKKVKKSEEDLNNFIQSIIC